MKLYDEFQQSQSFEFSKHLLLILPMEKRVKAKMYLFYYINIFSYHYKTFNMYIFYYIYIRVNGFSEIHIFQLFTNKSILQLFCIPAPFRAMQFWS